MRYSRLFRSRWAALLWGIGICWTAWEVSSAFAPPETNMAAAGQTDATGAAYNEADVQALKGALNAM